MLELGASSFGQRCAIVFRGRFPVLEHFAVRTPPVVTLALKGHDESTHRPIIFRVRITRNANHNLRLWDIQTQRAMQSIPPREYGPEI